MAHKVMVKQVKALLMDVRTLLFAFGVPLVFRFLIPGFDGTGFPAVMVAYVLLGLQGTVAYGSVTKVGLTQFPVTWRDHVMGLFLYQALCVMLAAALASILLLVTMGGALQVDVILKAVGLGLVVAGVITVAGLWLPAQMARLITMVSAILVMNLAIFQAAEPVFMPWLSTLTVLLLGAAVWGLLLGITLVTRPRAV